VSTTAHDIYGATPTAAPATPGSYGQPPHGYRLPDATRLGPVRLQVADLARSLAFYEHVLGLTQLASSPNGATLGSPGSHDGDSSAAPLVELVERPGARPMAARGRLGLYHVAILLPDRPALGRFVRHLAAEGLRAGAGDHLVSEAFYLTDPDGLGIEVYADRPRETWQRLGRELMLATDPVNVPDLVRAAGPIPWTGMPSGTAIGHVHLHVDSTEQAGAFFSEALGFDRMTWRYPGALFMGAGGYHHHLGTNTWAGAGARPPAPDDARLLEWTIELPDVAAVDGAATSLARAGHPVARAAATEVSVHDPWGTAVRLRVAPPDATTLGAGTA
jgi:catechol 2,3-dioxygenase